MSNQTNELKNLMASFFQMNTASTSGTGSLPSNTIANPKGKLKAITTRSGLVLDGPSVPLSSPFINPEEDERVEETLTDPEHGEFTIKVPPPLVQKAKPPSQRNFVVHQRDPRHPHIPYPSRMNHEKQKEKDEMLKSLLSNKEKLLELANTPLNENCSVVILKKLPKKLGEPWKLFLIRAVLRDELNTTSSSPSLPISETNDYSLEVFRDELAHFTLIHKENLMASPPKIDFLLDEFAGELTHLQSIPPGIDNINLDPEGDILFLESLLYDNSSPRPPEAFQDNSNTIIESLPTFSIPVEHSDSLREEIDIFPGPDDSIPPGIESDDFDSEDDNNSTFLPEFDSFHVDYPDSGDSTINVVEDIPVDVPNILPTHPAF
ncbi:hypothetical protein Tco_0700654 [Tanacetum coccineum]